MKIVFIALLLTCLNLMGKAQDTAIVEYLGISSKVKFDRTPYVLAWTSHPQSNYYKQEYLQLGDSLNRFKKMMLIEVLTGKQKLKSVVDAKTSELSKLKSQNPLVNFEVFEKDGEFILDFIVSQNSANGKYVEIVERNVYRYRLIEGNGGKKGVLLFGISERAYVDDINSFFGYLKDHRFDMINKVGNFDIPAVEITKL